MTVRSQRHLREFYGSDSSGEGQITLVPDLSLDFSDMTAGSDLTEAGIAFSGISYKTMFDSTGRLTYAPNNTLTAKSDMSTSVPSNCTGGTPAATPGYGNAKLITPHAGTDAFPTQLLSNPHITGNLIVSFVAKSNGITHLYTDNFGGLETFDLTTGAVTQSGGAPSTAGSISLGNGWYRFYVTHPGQSDWYFVYLYAGAYGTYTANGTDGFYVGGVQIEKVTYETTPRAFNPVTADNSPYYGPRFDHDPVTLAAKGLLIEEARTNLQAASQDLSNATYWTISNASVSANTATAPDGTVSADKIVETAVTNYHQVFQTPTLTAVVYTYSVYLKAAERTWAAINFQEDLNPHTAWFNLSNGTVGTVQASTTATITPAGNGWYRCTVTALMSVNTCYTAIRAQTADNQGTYAGDGTSGIYAWGTQLEIGSFATSYLPTVAGTASRAVDNPTMTGTDFSDWYNPIEGTFVAVYDTFNPNTSMVSALNGGGSLNEWSPISSAPSSGNIADYKLYTGGVQQAGITVSGLSINSLQKIAVAYKTNDFALVLNGAPSATDASGNVGNPDRIAFGSDGFGSYVLNGHIKSFAYYRTRLPDATLRSLTDVAPSLTINFLELGAVPSPLAFYRGSSGTYTNASGLVATAGVNVPRFDYDPITLRLKGLLIEAERTNLVLRSQELDQWNDYDICTVTTNVAIAPDGTMTADLLSASPYGGKYRDAVSLSGSTTYTASLYVKAVSYDGFYLTLQSGGGAGNVVEGPRAISSGTYVGNGWYRHTSTITTGAGDTQLRMVVRVDGTSNAFYSWGYQIELGAFATSYIPTTSASVTRNADIPISPAGTPLSVLLQAAQGTLVMSFGQARNTTSAYLMVGIGADGIAFQNDTVIGHWNGSSALNIDATPLTVGRARVGLSWNASGRSEVVTDVDLVSDAHVLGTGSTDVVIGGTGVGTRTIVGWVEQITAYPIRLSDAYLQELVSLPAATYYVDTAGNDLNDGLSQGTAWQTLAKVNASRFVSGATVLFKAGQTFTGFLVCPSQGMTFGSYGSGRATISSGGSLGFLALDKSGTTVRDLIFTGNGTSNADHGIRIDNDQSGNTKLRGVQILNCLVSGYGKNGIFVNGSNGASGFDDVLISDCVAHDCTFNWVTGDGSAGILVMSITGYGMLANGATHTDVVVRRCTAYNNPGTAGSGNWTGSGIFVAETATALIEYCVAYGNGAAAHGMVGIWVADCTNGTIQYCESHHNLTQPGQPDGDGFDLDGGCQNCLIQYCYSHDNDGSGFQVYSYNDPPYILQDMNNTVRYCVSENDGTRNQGGIMLGNDNSRPMLNVNIYNNTVYQSLTIARGAFWSYNPTGITANIVNNILYTSGTAYLIEIDGGTVSGLTFNGNVYYAAGSFKIKWQGTDYTTYASWRAATSQEAGNNGLTTDPMLTAPGAGAVSGRDLTSLSAYKIRSGSPAVNSGLVVSGAPAQDFYGDIVPLGGAYDRGAHELA